MLKHKSLIKYSQILRYDSAKDIEELRDELMTRHRNEIDRISEDHFEECQKMLKDFEHGQKFLKGKIEDLEKQVKQAAVDYINRESREEDVALINELQQLLDEQHEKARQYEVYF